MEVRNYYFDMYFIKEPKGISELYKKEISDSDRIAITKITRREHICFKFKASISKQIIETTNGDKFERNIGKCTFRSIDKIDKDVDLIILRADRYKSDYYTIMKNVKIISSEFLDDGSYSNIFVFDDLIMIEESK